MAIVHILHSQQDAVRELTDKRTPSEIARDLRVKINNPTVKFRLYVQDRLLRPGSDDADMLVEADTIIIAVDDTHPHRNAW